ncbi:hypothetical protein ACFLTI_07090 [Bacteroidota bacterium]
MNDRQNQFDKKFLILGDANEIQSHTSEAKLKKIVRKARKNKLPGIWGTLGWKDDKPFNPDIRNSKYGNTNEDKRDASAISIINNIKSFNNKIKSISNDVVERYINFDAADFNINWSQIKTYEDIPELRLDLFVGEMEGAIVYYYHQYKEKFGQLNDDAVYEQFIQCQKTDDNFTTKRDRLSYYFKLLPPFDYTITNNGQIDWSENERSTSFIIKIITFKRSEGTPKQLLKKFFSKENINLFSSTKDVSDKHPLFGKKKNDLLIYDGSIKNSSVASSKKNRFDMKGAFFKVDEKHKIDRNKKTLLLIHGTFSNTLNTFEGLIKLRNGGSELEDFLSKNNYKQVIAFNHPTISADVFDNIKVLKKLLGNEKFKYGVSILAASRGCIVAQAIGADKQIPFKVDKCLMFSPANGVRYFDFGEKLATGLGVLKKLTSGTPANYIFALLQFSADYFMDQPGAKQMTFGESSLNKVLKSKLSYTDSQYISIVNDWEKGLIDTRKKRFWMKIADGIIKQILGRKHDFVVGEEGQENMPEKYKVTPVYMACTHCKFFDKGELHEREGEELVLSAFMSRYL